MSEVFSKNILSQWQNIMFKRSLQLRSLTQNALMKIYSSEMIQKGLYYKTLRIRNIWQMDRFCCKPSVFYIVVTGAVALTSCKICILQVFNVFIVQAQGAVYSCIVYC
jgi:hypothetical protein